MSASGSKDRVFPYTGNIADFVELNIFVKRKLGNMCFVSSVPKDKDAFVGVGIILEEIAKDDLTVR